MWEQKKAAFQKADITVVSPSQWLAQQAAHSSLFTNSRVEVIHNGLDISAFKPRPRSLGIRKFDLNKNKKYILFGAAYDTQCKGGDLFWKAVEYLSNNHNISVLTFGSTGVENKQTHIPHTDLGWLSDNELRLAYSTSDVIVVPSRQEAFGQTASEAIASGTPVVAFNIGGLQDIVDHKCTGYLAEAFDPVALADGIRWAISNSDQELAQQARKSAEQRFSLTTVANQHYKLYKQITSH